MPLKINRDLKHLIQNYYSRLKIFRLKDTSKNLKFHFQKRKVIKIVLIIVLFKLGIICNFQGCLISEIQLNSLESQLQEHLKKIILFLIK